MSFGDRLRLSFGLGGFSGLEGWRPPYSNPRGPRQQGPLPPGHLFQPAIFSCGDQAGSPAQAVRCLQNSLSKTEVPSWARSR
jgi:hypothetical protein